MARPFADSINVGTAGTRVQISTSNAKVHAIIFKGRSGNTGAVYIGDSTVSAAVGFELMPGDDIAWPIREGTTCLLSAFWVDAATTNDDVDFAAVLES